MAKRNETATQFWEQLFATMAKAEDAAIMDADYDAAQDDERFRRALSQAGWSDHEIQSRIDLHRAQVASAPTTSPGVNPHVEMMFERLSDDIEAAMDRLHLDSHALVARGVEPRVRSLAAKTNVIMTNESVITVGSFLFCFCGLVARAFTRTLRLDPVFWESAGYSEKAARVHLRANPELMVYWLRIFISFSVTDTHIMVPFRPADRYEVMLFEQVARAMEIFAIAHEYGHHHLDHGRRIDSNPKLEEFDADQFALKIAYEVERKPLFFENPYLSSGAGGAVLLLALEMLREVREAITGERAKPSDTHPEIATRLARFDTVASLKPEEFVALKAFRTVSARIMKATEANQLGLLRAMPNGVLDRLRVLSQ